MGPEIDLRWYFAVLWRWAWLLVLAAMLAGAAALVASRATLPVYQASTTILVNEAPNARSADYNSILVSERLASTYSGLLTTRPLLEKVIQQLGIPMDPGALKGAVTVGLTRNTQLITVRVRDTDPQRAALIANTLVDVFANEMQQLQAARYTDSKENLSKQLAILDQQIEASEAELATLEENTEDRARRDRVAASLQQYRQSATNLLQSYEQVRLAEAQTSSNVIPVEPARASFSPISPRTRYNTILAAVVGLVAALGAVLLKETLDDTVKSPEELSRHLGLPVLGVIANFGTTDELPIVAAQPRSPVAEAFRNLRTNIGFASVDRPLTTLLVTSASPNEGKSTVISNLAGALAQNGRRVALVEADLRRPTLHKKLAMPNRVGISDLFTQPHVELDGAMQGTAIEGLSLMTSGELPPNPAELLGSEKMSQILGLVREHTDIVLVDTPPVLAVTDAVVLSQRVDGVLLVVKAGVTKLAACKQAVEQLRFVGANTIGVVINGIQVGRSGYGYSYHGYYYAYTYNSDDGNSTNSEKRSRWFPGRKSQPGKTVQPAKRRSSILRGHQGGAEAEAKVQV